MTKNIVGGVLDEINYFGKERSTLLPNPGGG